MTPLMLPALVLFGFGYLARCCCGDGGGGGGETISGCNSCNDLIARFYQVELVGIADVSPSPPCDACESLNGLYIVEIDRLEPTACYGALNIDGACNDEFDGGCYREMRLSFGSPSGSGLPVWVTIGPRPGDDGPGECTTVTSIMWRKFLGDPNETIDCLALDNEEFPFDNRTGFVKYCEAAASSAFVTALI